MDEAADEALQTSFYCIYSFPTLSFGVPNTIMPDDVFLAIVAL